MKKRKRETIKCVEVECVVKYHFHCGFLIVILSPPKRRERVRAGDWQCSIPLFHNSAVSFNSDEKIDNKGNLLRSAAISIKF